MTQVFTAWITKYCLTVGIEQKQVQQSDIDGGSMVSEVNDHWHQNTYHGEGRDWHRTREGAIKKAEEVRQKKIASVQRQLSRLRRMKFE